MYCKIKNAHHGVRRRKGYFFFCGESEQHPKWNSFAKAAPKAIWRLNILKEVMLEEEGEREKRGNKRILFFNVPKFLKKCNRHSDRWDI